MDTPLPPASERIVSAERTVHAPAEVLFELIADAARQPEWDGNDNLARAAEGQRVRAVGDVFITELTRDGAVRENHVVEFEEGRRIAWLPAPAGEQPRGHRWRWELEPVGDGTTRIRHTYDWTDLTDGTLLARIDRMEDGVPLPVGSNFVWTSTVVTGTLAGANCTNWRASGEGRGGLGQANATSVSWTTIGSGTCSDAFRLYCFQQI